MENSGQMSSAEFITKGAQLPTEFEVMRRVVEEGSSGKPKTTTKRLRS